LKKLLTKSDPHGAGRSLSAVFSSVLPFSPKNRDIRAKTWYNRDWKKYFVFHGFISRHASRQATTVVENDANGGFTIHLMK